MRAPFVGFADTSPGGTGDEERAPVVAPQIAFTLVCVLLLAFGTPVRAEERITSFDVSIDVEKDGDIRVVETINVVAEGNQIQRGIYRDLPRKYLKGARLLPFDYDVKRVTRDGAKEPYVIEREGNAFRVRIGDADVVIANGPHTYEIDYEVKNQVRYFADYDELYWDVTGNQWVFPIERARATVRLPGGAAATQTAAYTGREGAAESDYSYAYGGGLHRFQSTAPFAAYEGMTVAVGFAKGVVDPPSAADARADWWMVNASGLTLGAAFLLIALYNAFVWTRVGRDPVKGPVFARYEPPAGYSPAAVHHIYNRALKGHEALIATLLDLAVKKRIHINADTKKKRTTLRRLDGGDTDIPDAERALEARLFAGGDEFSFGKTYDQTLTSAYEAFRRAIGKAYGSAYFRWNAGFLAIAFILSGLAIFLAAKLSIEWTAVHWAGVAALGAMALAASYFLPAPTEKGQSIRTEIEGFRLYLKTAEQLQLNAVKVGAPEPPPMTVERYERFLPYAAALGVEKPWTEHFERLMPVEAETYRPTWSTSNHTGRSLSGFNSALVSSLSTGVVNSMPKSSGSSGSGGGGSSGGGGGGGGGGGW